jgi:septal ring factor EnvC (AmiA/AmiB activator)
MKDTQKKKLLAVTGMNEIPFIAEGLESTATGHIVSEDGLTRIAEALEETETAAARVTELEGQLATAQASLQAAEQNLATANEQLTTSQNRVKELEARVAELEEEPGVVNTVKGKDKVITGKKPFHASDANPMNMIADKFFGKPAAAVEE